MDFKKLSEVGVQKVADSSKKTVEEKKKAILDSIKKRRAARRQAVSDSIKKRQAAKRRAILDSKRYAKFKVTDCYKNLKKKIKDELEETETTDAAIETALSELTSDTPAEQVLAAVIEVLGDTIDELQEDELD